MEKFDVHILGCGSALPTTRHYSTAQVVNLREKLYMIDCGEGTQQQLRRSKLKFSRLNHIFLSHLHGDHCFGLIGLISTFGLMGRTATLHIHAPAELEPLLNQQLHFFCKGLTYHVAFHAVNTTAHGIVLDDRSVTIYSIPLDHRVPCCGYLFCEKTTLPHIRRDMIDFYQIPTCEINNIKNGKDWITTDGTLVPNHRLTFPAAPPRSYAYCSDTRYLPYLKQWIKGADLLFHEATFLHQDLSRAKETGHSTAQQAATAAAECQVKKLCIGHFSARYEDETLLLQEAQQIFANTILAKENLVLSL